LSRKDGAARPDRPRRDMARRDATVMDRLRLEVGDTTMKATPH
jgi:hypothetical protein